MSWTDGERARFEAGVRAELDVLGIECRPEPGSLRVTIGSSVVGAGVLVTWASTASGRLTQHRATVGPAALAAILRDAGEKLHEPTDPGAVSIDPAEGATG